MSFSVRSAILTAIIACSFWLTGYHMDAQQPSEEPARSIVSVGPDGSGNWTVSYEFKNPQSVLAFVQSANDYRTATWSLQTNDARFGRVDGIDVIVFDRPATKVSFSIIPLTSKLQGEPTPFVPFRDGGIAVHEGQLRVVPFASLSAVQGLKGDLLAAQRSPLPLAVRVSSENSIIVRGEATNGVAVHPITGDGDYIYLGKGDIAATHGLSAVIDGTMPDWLAARLAKDVRDLTAELSERWGFALSEPLTLMAAYKGGDGRGLSAESSASGASLMLELGGAGLSQPNSDTLAYLHWFIARSLMPLYQTENGARLGGPSSGWIHKGGANTMAYQLVASKMDTGTQFLTSVYAGAFEECAHGLQSGPLETAWQRGASDADYACGSLIALATDGFLRRRDLYGFWNALTEWAARSGDRTIDKAVYFTTLQLLGATPGQRDMVRAIVEDELSNPRQNLTRMLASAGLSPKFDASGKLIALDLSALQPG
ncbi:hypothetical protein [Henriciella litoralis]|uniref:hypothetical protein n=1 Tax=Henriciella litoralis TaxID=568102 RepID=UPI00111C7AC2|nr:hypothetical protein [Henriciella litoralis]